MEKYCSVGMNVSTHSLKAFRPKLSEVAGHPREARLVGNFMDLHGSTSALNILNACPSACKGNRSDNVYNSCLRMRCKHAIKFTFFL